MIMRMTGCAALIAAVALPAAAIELRDIPAPVTVAGGKVLATVTATGTQNYECVKTPKGALAWSFREPVANMMMDGKPAGKHFAGPTWEFTDGSRLTARVADKADGKSDRDIPWLKLAVVEKAKKGPASGSKWVLRVETEGGVLSGTCDKQKDRRAEPYKATYLFVK